MAASSTRWRRPCPRLDTDESTHGHDQSPNPKEILMDRRRRAVILLAIILAGLGTALLVAAVNATQDDAVVVATSPVVMVTEAVERGSDLAGLTRRVEVVEIPTDLVQSRALVSLDEVNDPALRGRVVGVDLFPGDQVLLDRLVVPDALTRVEVPEGLGEITVSLDPQRALGGTLTPGDLVAVAVSLSGDDLAVATSRIVAHRLLVTAVAAGSADRERVGLFANGNPSDGSEGTDGDLIGTTGAPGVTEAVRDDLLVTMAVTTAQAEVLVHAAVNGDIWLIGQDPDTDISGGRPRTSAEIFGVSGVVTNLSEVAS